MLQQNISIHQRTKNQSVEFDKKFDHMVNPIEFQIMDQEVDMRNERTRKLKKADDDKNNKIIMMNKKGKNKSRAAE